MLKPADYVSSYLPAALDVEYLVNCDERSILQGNRIASWSVELFHDDSTRAPLLLDDGTNDASQYFIDGSITWNSTADCQYQCQLVFMGELADQFSTETALVRIFDCEWNRADNQVLKVPRGWFRFSVPQRDLVTEKGDSLLTVTGYDLTYRLQKVLPLHDLVVPSGINVTTAMVALLRQDDHEADEGGRAASGIPLPGTPQAGLPVYTGTAYATTGMPVSGFPIDGASGCYKSPAGPYGVVFYSPYDAARCDPTTYAPIDPWTKGPMQPYPSATTGPAGATVIWLTSQAGVVYKSQEGLFYRLTTGNLVDLTYVLDPLKMQPLPSGLVYKHPDVATGGTLIGTLPTPLSTWPYDYDHSGPYYDAGGATNFTTGATGPGPASLRFTPSEALVDVNGFSIQTVLGAGDVDVRPGATTTDPSSPALTIITPFPYSAATRIQGPSISGYVFPTTTWTVTQPIQGTGNLSGSVAIAVEVYEHLSGGGEVHRGSLALGAAVGFSGGFIQSASPSASGTVTGFTAGGGSTLSLNIKLTVVSAIMADLTTGTGEATVLAHDTLVTFGGTPTVPAGSSYTDPGGTAGSVTPNLSGSTIPWPQTTYPALASSGCAVLGPNWPADLIDIPDTTTVTLVPMTWSGTTTIQEFLNQLGALAQFQPLGINLETGAIETAFQPYTQNADPLVIEKTYSNELPQTDGLLCSPVSQKLVDELQEANVIEVTASSNANGTSLVAVIKNDEVDSPVSSVNLHRREIKKIQADELQTQQQVNERALLEALIASEATWSLDIQVPRDPFHARYGVINVVYKTDDGRFLLNGRDNPYICTAWTEEAWNPLMRITCAQTVALGGGSGGSGGSSGGGAMRIGSPLGEAL